MSEAVMYFRRRRRRLHLRRGTIVVLTALLLVPLLGFAVISVDLGYIAWVQGQLQCSADAAALSGVLHLSDGPDSTRQAAVRVSQANVAAGRPVRLDSRRDIVLGIWDPDTAMFTALSGSEEDGANAVKVYARLLSQRKNPLRLFLGSFLGKSVTDVESSATAAKDPMSCGAFIGLNRVYLREQTYTDSYDSSMGPYHAGSAGSNGDVCSNGHIRLISTAGINGDAHPGPEEDGVDFGSSATYVTGDQTKLKETIDYPPVRLHDVVSNNDNDSITASRLGHNPLVGGAFSLTAANDSVDLASGKYYFDSLELTNGATIHVTGPTFIYVNGDVDLTDAGIRNETLLPMNLQLYPLGESFWLPATIDLHAVIYSTTSAVERATGTGHFYGKIVGQKVKINGSGGLHADDSVEFTELLSGGAEIGGPFKGIMLVD